MRLLNDMLSLYEADKLGELPEGVLAEVQKNIRSGAKDTEQKWSNALELVQKAYEVAGVQRPTPDMKDAWKQYEQMLEYGVQQLARYRGLKGDWRMSSAIFHEALQPKIRFAVRLADPEASVTYQTEEKSLKDLIEYIVSQDQGGYEIKPKIADDGLSATLLFFRYGVRVKYRVDITQLGSVWSTLAA